MPQDLASSIERLKALAPELVQIADILDAHAQRAQTSFGDRESWHRAAFVLRKARRLGASL